MDMKAKHAVLERGLERAAERLGDPTQPVITAFYARHPEAQAAFERLALGKRANLEGEMVSQVLYCLMTWFESPGEVEIVLMGSVPHHAQTLEVNPAWYEGLIAASCAVLGADAQGDERAVWDAVEADLRGVVRESMG
ncbi:MAG: hypothetical protein KGN34_03805 [Sphingomonadales bacterium]|nr:hypothetical protein [Sphingomonadales bacterium]